MESISPPRAAATACATCADSMQRGCRFCPRCGAYLHPRSDRVLEHVARRAAWPAVRQALVLYFVYFATLLPLAWAPAELADVAELGVTCLDAALIVSFLLMAEIPVRELLVPTAAVRAATLRGLLLMVPLLGLNFAYHSALVHWLGASDPGWLDPRETWLWAIGLSCVMPAVVEELAFRGLLWRLLGRAIRPREVLVVTAILFAVIHVAWLSLPYLFVCGLALGWLRHRSGSLLPCMAIHFLHNLVVLLVERDVLF